LSSSVQNSEGGGGGGSGYNFADPCQEFKQGFLGVSSGLPLVSLSRICINILEGDMTQKKLIPKPFRGSDYFTWY
jgi:hypothetical protein